MRASILIVLLASFLCGCKPAVVYQAQTFREDVDLLIHAERYGDAIALLEQVDLDQQLAHDRSGYMLIAEDLIFRPGMSGPDSFPQDGDWALPGTSDAIPNAAIAWQEAATEFAEHYNRARWKLEHP
ncbi:MAG: hypothetical protein ACIAXF_11575 [Phycisphaerales bacterium JB063]